MNRSFIAFSSSSCTLFILFNNINSFFLLYYIIFNEMSVDRSLMIVIYGRTKCQLVGGLLETKVQLRFIFLINVGGRPACV